jgi:hypothetical protein
MATTDTSITLTLEGNPTLPLFTDALEGLSETLNALTRQFSDEVVEWVVENLEIGSTVTTIRGYGTVPEIVTQTTAALMESATVADHGLASDVLAQPVVYGLRKLTRVLNGVIPALSLSSGSEEVRISAPNAAPTQRHERVSAFGSLTGTVQMLSQTRGLHFRIIDDTYGYSVPGRFREEITEEMRAIWGDRAIVQGLITRDRRTGRPIAITEVRDVQPAPEVKPGAFLRARGALSADSAIAPSEEAVRRLRDAS